jgi:hypothetical protein
MQDYLFRTPVTPPRAKDPISVASNLFFIGSCFAENIGRHLVDARFNVLVNPFGVLYNPLSIAAAFDSIIDLAYVSEDDLVERDGLWHNFMYHGKFSNPDKNICMENINIAIDEARDFLEKADYLIITFGTAWVYEHKLLQKVVANCHKFPDSDFRRYRLEPDEVVDAWKELIIRLRVFNPGLKVIFTVSPVRHLKDGTHGNQLSKAVLLLAIDKLVDLFDKVEYFPAYEILMDELRDYRFYDRSMVHPDGLAVEYIVTRFCENFLDEEAQKFYKEVDRLIKARSHRPSGHNTVQYIQFVSRTLSYIHELSLRYPEARLEDDRLWFQKILEDLNKS